MEASIGFHRVSVTEIVKGTKMEIKCIELINDERILLQKWERNTPMETTKTPSQSWPDQRGTRSVLFGLYLLLIWSYKQWLHCRKWQFWIAYMVHKWISWFKVSVVSNFLFFLLLFLMPHIATLNIGLGSYNDDFNEKH